MRHGECGECNKVEPTGWMPCVDRWLCAKCAAGKLGVSEGEAKAAILDGFFLLMLKQVKKGGDKNCSAKSKRGSKGTQRLNKESV